MASRATLLVLAGLTLAACARGRTSATILIDSDIQRSRVFTLRAAAVQDDNSAPTWHTLATFGPAHSTQLPVSFTVLAPESQSLTTTLLLDVVIDGSLTFRRTTQITFVRGHTVDVRLFLSDRCAAPRTSCVSPGVCTLAALCEERGLTCGDNGECASRIAPSQPTMDSATPDATLDATPEHVSAPVCVEGETRCVGAVWQRCQGGAFENAATCATTALCLAEGCAPPVCAAGALRCRGAYRERCNDESTGWDHIETCATSELCTASRCDAPACASNALRCVGANREQCNSGRTGWEVIQTCVSARLCAPNGCIAPVCEVGERRCDGSVRQECRGDRSGWDTVEVCTGCTRICTPNACEDACA
jgi:hypothetical protein